MTQKNKNKSKKSYKNYYKNKVTRKPKPPRRYPKDNTSLMSKILKILRGIVGVLLLAFYIASMMSYDTIRATYLRGINPHAITFLSIVGVKFCVAYVLWFTSSFIWLGYWMNFYEGESLEFKKFWKFHLIIFVVWAIFFSAPLMVMKERYDITAAGLTKYSMFGKERAFYPWSDISKGDTYVTGGKKYPTLHLEYNIILKNGKKLWIASDIIERWNYREHITNFDNLMRTNNVNIYRDATNLNKLDDECYDFVAKFVQ